MLFALFTKNGGQSSYVQQEIGYAKKAGKIIVPFVESGVEPGNIRHGRKRRIY